MNWPSRPPPTSPANRPEPTRTTTGSPLMSDGPDPIDTRLVRRLAAILNSTGLSEIEVERDGLKIRVARTVTLAPTVVHAPAPAPALAAAAPASEPAVEF